MTNRPYRFLILVLAALLAGPALPAVAQDEEVNLLDAITKGTFSLNLRYRYEDVDQDGFDDKGQASTLRTSFGYSTQWWKGLMVFAEFEDVHGLGLSDDHNNNGDGSWWNEVTDRPVIPDPESTEINQAYLGIRPVDGLVFRAGLQEVVIDNARFIGNVGWRQNHQSFEAINASFDRVSNLFLGFTYLGQVHTITGASLPMSSYHGEAGWTFGKIGTLTGYLLSLDYDNEAKWALSTSTYGVFFDGDANLSEKLRLNYRLEIAQQSDSGNNPNNVDAGYRRADLGVAFGKLTVAGGYEVLEGGPGDGKFTTPLATLHKFNGWADKFLTTPDDGLEDLFLSVTAKLGSFSLSGIYHDFSANTGSSSWGNEFDAHIVYTAPWKQKFALKLARYSADDWATDTDKIWLWTSWGF